MATKSRYLSATEFADLIPDNVQLLSDEPEMESSLHYLQLMLLVSCLDWLWRDQSDYFIGANLTVYYSLQQLRDREFRGPDFFLVKNTTKQPRASWVVWEEDGKYPDLIIELLSNSTARVDRTEKKDLYQNRWRTPEYFWFSPDTSEFAGFRLMGLAYEQIPVNEQGWRWSEELNLYLGVQDRELRYFTPEGELVPTPKEAALQAQQGQQQAQQQAQRAQQELIAERQRAEALAARLRALGIDENDL